MSRKTTKPAAKALEQSAQAAATSDQQPAITSPVAETTNEPDMPCATCGGNVAPPEPTPPFEFTPRSVETPPEGFVQMRFTGPQIAPITYLGEYQGCVSCPPVWVNPGHVARLELTGMWQRVEVEPEAP